MRRVALVVAAGSLWLTCNSSPIRAGGHCDDSEQCAAGLLCDTTQTPPVCSTMLKNVPDLASSDGSADDLAVPDLGPGDDLAATQHDMAKPADL